MHTRHTSNQRVNSDQIELDSSSNIGSDTWRPVIRTLHTTTAACCDTRIEVNRIVLQVLSVRTGRLGTHSHKSVFCNEWIYLRGLITTALLDRLRRNHRCYHVTWTSGTILFLIKLVDDLCDGKHPKRPFALLHAVRYGQCCWYRLG